MNAQTTAPASDNPFFREWTGPFGMPPFAEIRNEHFLPGLERGIAEQRKEVIAVADNSAPPTFANTIEALDKTGELLDKVSGVFSNLAGAETNETIEGVSRKVAPMMAALRDDRLMNPKLFARVKAVWEKRNSSGLDAEQIRLVDETYKEFVRGGANLDDAGKARLRTINSELSTLL